MAEKHKLNVKKITSYGNQRDSAGNLDKYWMNQYNTNVFIIRKYMDGDSSAASNAKASREW